MKKLSSKLKRNRRRVYAYSNLIISSSLMNHNVLPIVLLWKRDITSGNVISSKVLHHNFYFIYEFINNNVLFFGI